MLVLSVYDEISIYDLKRNKQKECNKVNVFKDRKTMIIEYNLKLNII